MAEEDTSLKMEADNKLPVPKIKYDWYQTDTQVIITILAKNSENVEVDCDRNTLIITACLPMDDDYMLELDLAHRILAQKSWHKIFPSKIEITLVKAEAIRWNSLEKDSTVTNTVQAVPQEIQAASEPLKYPSSSKKSRDWDKVAKEIEKQEADEKLEGEAAVNALFQQIYGKGSDEVKRAMNKSFQESGGTVLSTNWAEVGKGEVERQPPDGMEWKSYSS